MFSCPAPRRGSWFTISTSSATVRVPSPTTCPGIRRAAATSMPSMTSSRWSSPAIMLSTTTPAALVDRDLEGVRHLGVGREVHRDAAAVVAVDRLHHHREADVARRLDRVLGVADVQLLRHRQPEVGEQPRAELLVRGDLDGGVRGLAGQRRLDPLLVLALADLDQAGVVQPHPGDVARLGRAHQRQRRRPERAARGEAVEVLDRLGDVDAVVLGGDQLEHAPRAPRRRPRARSPRTRSRRAPRPRPASAAGPGEGDLGRGAAAVLQRDRHLRHQLAEPAVRVLQPLGQRLAGLGDGGDEPGQLVEQRRRARRHSPTPASRPAGAGRRSAGSAAPCAKTFGPT